MIKGINPSLKTGDRIICRNDINKDGKKTNVTIGKTYEVMGRPFSFGDSYWATITNDRGEMNDYRCEDFETVKESRSRFLEDLLQ